MPLAPPPIVGLGTGGGFTYVWRISAAAIRKCRTGAARASSSPPTRTRGCRVFSTFSATNPSIYLDIDRDKAQILGVSLSGVFQALQASLGGYYVNDMNLFGRTWKVQVQAEASDRARVDDIYRINVRSDDGKMIPMRSLAESRRGRAAGSDPLQQQARGHHSRRPAPGVSPARRLPRWKRSRRKRCRRLYRRMDRHPFQEKRAEGKTAIILGFAVLFAYLFLVGALRELDDSGAGAVSVSVGVLGSFVAIVLAG